MLAEVDRMVFRRMRRTVGELTILTWQVWFPVHDATKLCGIVFAVPYITGRFLNDHIHEMVDLLEWPVEHSAQETKSGAPGRGHCRVR